MYLYVYAFVRVNESMHANMRVSVCGLWWHELWVIDMLLHGHDGSHCLLLPKGGSDDATGPVERRSVGR